MKRRQWIFLIISLIILIPAWLYLFGFSLYCSTSLSCNADASGWWSLFITVVGIPIVIFQLYGLRNSIESLINKPEVEIGIDIFAPYLPQASQKERPSKLPVETSLSVPALNQFLANVNEHPEILRLGVEDLKSFAAPIRILIKNTGKRSLQYYKISLTIKSFPGNRLPVLFIDQFRSTPDHKAIFFNGGADNIIYPGDGEELQLYLVPDELTLQAITVKRHINRDQGPDSGDLYFPGKYEFVCTIWGEGMDRPEQETLTLWVQNDLGKISASDLPVLHEKDAKNEYGTSKYGFETDADRERKIAQEEERKKMERALEEKKSLEADACADKIADSLQGICADFISSYHLEGYQLNRRAKRTWLLQNEHGRCCSIELIEEPELCLDVEFDTYRDEDSYYDDAKFQLRNEATRQFMQALSEQTGLRVGSGIKRSRNHLRYVP